MSAAYEPSDDDIIKARRKVDAAAADCMVDPFCGVPFAVIGMVDVLLESAALAEQPATRAQYVRQARAALKAYDGWQRDHIASLEMDDPREAVTR